MGVTGGLWLDIGVPRGHTEIVAQQLRRLIAAACMWETRKLAATPAWEEVIAISVRGLRAGLAGQMVEKGTREMRQKKRTHIQKCKSLI